MVFKQIPKNRSADAMGHFIFKRVFQLIPLMVVISFLVFGLMHLAQGDPAERKLLGQGMAVEKEVLDAKRAEWGLDRPFLDQYGHWLKGALKGDLGTSYKDGRPVREKLQDGFKKTFILAGVATGLSVAIAIPLGIFTAVHQNKWPDVLLRFFSFIGNSIPNFLLCILLIYFFCIRQQIFSIIAKNSLSGLFLPVLSLSIPLIGKMLRQVRAEVLEQMKKDHILAAQIRGVKPSYILFHNALYNALPGIITLIGLSIGTLFGGSVVIETIFRWPGAGKLVMDAILYRDYPVIQGFVLYSALIYGILHILIDIAYKAIDPRREL